MSKRPDPDLVTRLLAEMADGSEAASTELLQVVYDQLHGMARRLMSDQRQGHTLQTTALLNEAWMRLVGGESAYQTQEHFLRVAARAMRSVLVDHARRRTAQKRRRDLSRPLESDPVATLAERPEDLVALDDLLTQLGEMDEELLRIVELRFFGGLTLEETGAVMGMTIRQVHRRWTMARGWLRTRLADQGADTDEANGAESGDGS